jgi:hypothetical protein
MTRMEEIMYTRILVGYQILEKHPFLMAIRCDSNKKYLMVMNSKAAR